MFFLPIGIGFIFGLIVYIFMYIISKRSGKYYLAPFINFFGAILVTMYGIFVVRGFEGMAYGLLGFGMLITAIIGTLLLPMMVRKVEVRKEFSKKDKVSLFLLPLLFFAIVYSLVYFDKGYWIIDEGTYVYSESIEQRYWVSTISEGKKAVYIRLGKEYLGNSIEINKVTQRGQTTVFLDVKNDGDEDRAPYIKIGLDQVKDELIVKTTDGKVIE